MRTIAAARLLAACVLALNGTAALAGTIVKLQGDNGNGGEVCRFRAGAPEDPFLRWMTSQEVTCVPSGSSVAFPPGLWNVFARSTGMISADPIVVDAALPPEALTIPLVPAATLTVQLPAGDTGVIYAPKRATSFPATEKTTVPAAEELWLFVLAKSVPVGVVVLPPLDAGSTRAAEWHSPSAAPNVVAWLQVPDADRAALKSAHSALLPRIRFSSTGKENEAATLPPPAALDGAFILLSGVSRGEGELQLAGRGWFAVQRKVTVGTEPVTLVRQPIVGRVTATLVVNWSTASDLPALERSLGLCDPPAEPPRFELIVSSCPAGVVAPRTAIERPAPDRPRAPDGPRRRAEAAAAAASARSAGPPEVPDAAACQPIRTTTLRPEDTYGTVTVEEIPPGNYRAELRFGRLPPVSMRTVVAPLQQAPVSLQAWYVDAYGSLTRGGQPLGEDAQLHFPQSGIGFAPRESDQYHAVLLRTLDIDAKIDVVTCRGARAFVLADRPMMRNGRFDIDIPDNSLTVTVVDTFTRMAITTATLRYVVMSMLVPRVPVVTRVLAQSDADLPEGAEQVRGAFVIRAVPQRELRLEVSSRGYKTQKVDPFSITKSEKKEIEVQLVPLSGSQGKIVSAQPFEKAMIFWYSSAGVETEHADLAPDGTFFYEEPHPRSDTMTVVSASHPLWITSAPPVERSMPLQVRFPDGARVRGAEVSIPSYPPYVATLIGVAIGGLRVPAQPLAQHLGLRGIQSFVRGAGPLPIPDLLESGPIDILRGPSAQMPRFAGSLEAMALRDFVPTATRRLAPDVDKVEFGAK